MAETITITINVEKILEEIKNQYIIDFGSLKEEQNMNGYFIVGFMETVLKSLNRIKQAKQ